MKRPGHQCSNSACTQRAHQSSQPASPQNASEHMCRQPLGCIPLSVATQPDLGRSDFAILLPGLRQSMSGGHPFARTSHQRRAQRRTRT